MKTTIHEKVATSLNIQGSEFGLEFTLTQILSRFQLREYMEWDIYFAALGVGVVHMSAMAVAVMAGTVGFDAHIAGPLCLVGSVMLEIG